MQGRILDHFQILGPLGAGGMGEVYRARDTNLKRDVAIKVLPQELAGDPRRLERLERDSFLPWLRVTPLDSMELPSDPRIDELLDRLGLP